MALSFLERKESVTMVDESAQRPEEEAQAPAARRRASSQDEAPAPQKPHQRGSTWSAERAVRLLANVLCLVAL